MNEELLSYIRALRSKLAKVSGVGHSGDDHDLYVVIQGAGALFAQAHPSFACTRGCSACCQDLHFRVTDIEWRQIRKALLGWEPDRLHRLLDTVRERFGPFRETLDTVARQWKKTKPDTGTPLMYGVPRGCPLLVDDVCAVYENRPAVCRAYGYFGRIVMNEPIFMICEERSSEYTADLVEHGRTTLTLPPYDPIEKRLIQLNRGGRVAPIPLWLMELGEELHEKAQAREA